MLWFLLCNAKLSVLSRFPISSLRKKELVSILSLYFSCHVTVRAWCLFHVVPWVGMWSVILALSGLTHMPCDYINGIDAIFIVVVLQIERYK